MNSAHEAASGGRDGLGEQHPHVRAAPRLGDLQRRRYAAGTGRLRVRERIEHRRGAVEVRHQEVTRVVGQQRVQPDEDVTDQMRGDHLGRQRQVGSSLSVHSLTPTAGHRGHPSAHPRAGVIPPQRVHVGPCPEPIGVQGQLVGHRRGHHHQPRRRDSRGQLLRRRSGVQATQLQ